MGKVFSENCSDIPPYALLIGGNPRASQNNMATVHSCPLELEDNNLSVRTPHKLTTEHGERKPGLIWKLSPFWPAFTVMEGSLLVVVAREGRNHFFSNVAIDTTMSQ